MIESSAAVNTIAGLLEGTVDPEALIEELGVDLPPDFAGLDLDLRRGSVPGPRRTRPGPDRRRGLVPHQRRHRRAAGRGLGLHEVVQLHRPAGPVGAPRAAACRSCSRRSTTRSCRQTWADTLAGRWNTVAFGGAR